MSSPEYKERRRTEARAAGMCITCWHRKAAENCVTCESCQSAKRESEKRWREKLKATRRCRVCQVEVTDGKTRCPVCRQVDSKRVKVKTEELKISAYNAYGGPKCNCCGETEIQFLTIDHVNNNGAEHKREVWGSRSRRASGMYLWLQKNDYPQGFQVLCFNCNCGKHRNGGLCPHVSRALPTQASSPDRQ
jgi:hypothetical protein